MASGLSGRAPFLSDTGGIIDRVALSRAAQDPCLCSLVPWPKLLGVNESSGRCKEAALSLVLSSSGYLYINR